MEWSKFGVELKKASTQGMTAEQFAEVLNMEVEKVRQMYQSFKIKVRANVRKKVEMKVAAGEPLTKSLEEVITDNYERLIKEYTLKGSRGRRSDDLGLDFDLDM